MCSCCAHVTFFFWLRHWSCSFRLLVTTAPFVTGSPNCPKDICIIGIWRKYLPRFLVPGSRCQFGTFPIQNAYRSGFEIFKQNRDGWTVWMSNKKRMNLTWINFLCNVTREEGPRHHAPPQNTLVETSCVDIKYLGGAQPHLAAFRKASDLPPTPCGSFGHD